MRTRNSNSKVKTNTKHKSWAASAGGVGATEDERWPMHSLLHARAHQPLWHPDSETKGIGVRLLVRVLAQGWQFPEWNVMEGFTLPFTPQSFAQLRSPSPRRDNLKRGLRILKARPPRSQAQASSSCLALQLHLNLTASGLCCLSRDARRQDHLAKTMQQHFWKNKPERKRYESDNA